MRILFAPLDWGLGHVTRMIPLAKTKLAEGNDVVLACSPGQVVLLSEHFPDLQVLGNLPAYSPKYSHQFPLWVSMLFQSARLFSVIRAERQWIRELISVEKIDLIISDHRLGLYHPSVPSFILAHQLKMRGPWWLMPMANKIQAGFMNRFSECLIPDDAAQTLSGNLSSPEYLKIPFTYIGPLSRFSTSIPRPEIARYEWCVILSGPDPMRSEFLKRVLSIFQPLNIATIVVAGDPNNPARREYGSVTVVSHLGDDVMEQTIATSRNILCRSGYSTIMDLAVWKRRALLVPTAGQTEQEYLARWHSRNGWHLTCEEAVLDVQQIMLAGQKFSGNKLSD